MPMPWEQDYSAASPPPAAAMPWEKDYGAAHTPRPGDPDFKPGWGSVWSRIKEYPGIVGEGIKEAFTAPSDAYEGKIDTDSAEGVARALGTASVIAPGARPIARFAGARNPAFPPPSPNLRAAQTAADLGAPLPSGLVSENPAIQASTQAARQLPLVGQKIDERLGQTVNRAGEAVGEVADSLAPGTSERATLGASLRPSLEGVIADNKSRIDAAFGALRHVIDPDQVAALPRTEAALRGIVSDRIAAGQSSPLAGLEDVANLAKDGASFNGLQRARSDIGNSLSFGEAHPGFNKGDLKRVYAAMSGDMEDVVRSSAQPGVHPDDAAAVLHAANTVTSRLIENNKALQKLLSARSDEGLAGSVLGAAQGKTGNARLLAQLRGQMDLQDFEQIAGVAMRELGHTGDTFSLNKFAKNWQNLGDTSKGILFEPNHRAFLDQIANLGDVLKGGDQFRNTSNTGRAAMHGALVAEAGEAALTLNPMKLLSVLGGLGGGYVMAKALARPATAASIAKWTRTAQLQQAGASPARQASLTVATRNMLGNLSAIPGFDRGELIKRLQAPATNENNPQADSVAQPKRPKVQDRYPQ